jgi:hypothetical protein
VSASDGRNPERARLHELVVVGEAERAVADLRMAELKAAHDHAWRRHIAAKGLVTRARKDGSAERLAAAVDRERHAYTDFMTIGDATIEEMFAINSAGLERLGDLLDQVRRTWDADTDAVLRSRAANEPWHLWLGFGVKRPRCEVCSTRWLVFRHTNGELDVWVRRHHRHVVPDLDS